MNQCNQLWGVNGAVHHIRLCLQVRGTFETSYFSVSSSYFHYRQVYAQFLVTSSYGYFWRLSLERAVIYSLAQNWPGVLWELPGWTSASRFWSPCITLGVVALLLLWAASVCEDRGALWTASYNKRPCPLFPGSSRIRSSCKQMTEKCINQQIVSCKGETYKRKAHDKWIQFCFILHASELGRTVHWWVYCLLIIADLFG